MNKILTNIVFVVIAVIVIVVLGNLFFISNLDTDIKQIESEIAIKRNDLEKGHLFDACVNSQLGWPEKVGGLG